MFSPVVLSQWIPDIAGGSSDSDALVVVDPDLPANRSVSLLHVKDGPVVLSLSPARAHELGLTDGDRVDDAELAARIGRSGLSFHDPDHLFYLSLNEQAVLRCETPGGETRQLTHDDAALFDECTGQAAEDDLDQAFVELDHWLVFGTFVGGKLVCVASMYPWGTTRLADLGVITLAEFRGRGVGRSTVRGISAAALGRGYEPQYRCQLDNVASVALARAAGFTRFGEWEVVDADD